MASAVPRQHRRRKHRMADMNVVPYIDVMLVLLIIFMITSPLLVEGVNVQLPKSSAQMDDIKANDKGELMVISLNAAGEIFFQNEDFSISEDELKARLLSLVMDYKKNMQEVPTVHLKADERLPYGEVIRLMAKLREMDFVKVSLVIQKE
ncbi:ExbD/TolR family protein [Thioflexithrix psekupsensis]|uniref:Tol-Pal system protein TolR n=1 Tax=Thioflexithrix psekupsensis TaxID=1570016 RepID=A0A251XBA2_9GAMM|nr:biopolymer transporter ExbD [Thioflexithrix psekupsensis]OUD15573.1 hypothetical protein TPSD3_03365 [Thioflexithrix psekupsensis]